MSETSADSAAAVAAVPWDEVRAAYETTALPIEQVLSTYGVSFGQLYYRVRRQKWLRRRPAVKPVAPAGPGPELARASLVDRLFQQVERQLAEIERRFDAIGDASGDDKDARALATLTRTLELLMALDAKSAGASAAGRAGATEAEIDIDGFRRDLARRIETLRGPGPSG